MDHTIRASRMNNTFCSTAAMVQKMKNSERKIENADLKFVQDSKKDSKGKNAISGSHFS